MSLHRLVAIVSATALVGLFGLAGRAEASNFHRAESKGSNVEVSKPNATAILREKIRNAHIEGCGG